MESADPVQQVKIAAERLTLACAHLVGSIPMAIGLAHLRQISDPLPDVIDQLFEAVAKVERKDQ